MNDKLKKVLKYSGLIFIIIFILLVIEKSSGMNLGLRHRKVLAILLKISLGVFLLLLLYKSLLGYKSIIANKDYGMFKELIKTVLIVLTIIIILNFLLNINRVIKKNIFGQMVKLLVFILITFGLAYDEM